MQTQPRNQDNITFPNGFLDFLTGGGRRHRIGDCELELDRMQHFNDILHELSPNSPALTQDQIVTAGRRLLARHAANGGSTFIASRMRALTRLEELVNDPDWEPVAGVRESMDVLHKYRDDPNRLLPASEPAVGGLDEAVLIDVALLRMRDELADYEDFCRFRNVAAAFAKVPVTETGLTRDHWLEAMLQAHASRGRLDPAPRDYAPDPRATLFHIC